MAQHIQTVLQEGRAEAQVKYWDVDGVGYNWINFFELLYYQTLSRLLYLYSSRVCKPALLS